MSDRTVTVGLVQHACVDDHAANTDRNIAGIAAAASRGAQLVLLQELHGHRYFCQTQDARHFALAEAVPGPTCETLAAVAARHAVVIVASLFEQRAPGLYHNTAVVLDSDGRLAGRYRKMHIPDDPGYYEKYYFTPGDLGFTPVETSVGTLGVLVCWDQWFPEAARLMALAGAELLLYPTAIGWDDSDQAQERARQQDAWLTVQRGHAVANCLPVMTCNRTGLEHDPSGRSGGIHFWGSSSIIGPQGEILAQAAEDEDAVVVVELDLSRGERLRQDWPFLRDRRIDAYRDLLRRFRD